MPSSRSKKQLTIYGIPNCDTMKKAFDWLQEKNIPHHFHNYKTEGISADKIRYWLKQADLLQLVNTKSTTYKSLSEADKKSMANIDKALPLIMQYPSMIKRPVVEFDTQILCGFNETAWETLLG